MCKQIAMSWLFCNKVNTVLLITVDLLVKKWQVQEKRSDRDIGENEEKEKGSEGAVKREPLTIIHGPD